MLCMILATDMDYGIGKNNTLPWHCSVDLMVFKALTKDQVIAMGHNTWKSLPKKPLPDRDHIVLSRNPELKLDYPRVEHLKSVSQANSYLSLSKSESVATQSMTLALSDFFNASSRIG